MIALNDCFDLLWKGTIVEEFFYQLFNLSLLFYGLRLSVEMSYKGINNLISYNDKDEEENKMSPFLKAKIIKILSSEGQTLIDATDSSKS